MSCSSQGEEDSSAARVAMTTRHCFKEEERFRQ
jgi:hypothetical protein